MFDQDRNLTGGSPGKSKGVTLESKGSKGLERSSSKQLISEQNKAIGNFTFEYI